MKLKVNLKYILKGTVICLQLGYGLLQAKLEWISQEWE